MQLVITYKEKVTTTSLLVAKKFGKDHNDVIKVIQNLECSERFRELNFELSSYNMPEKRGLPMYILTRDAFTMLVMSFTGDGASLFREEFIEEFNKMEAILKQGQTPTLIPIYQMRILSEPTKSCPFTHWTVFDESSLIMMFIEKHIGSLNKFDMVDGSIGMRWSKFREDKEWAVEPSKYHHEFEDKRGSVECKCYQNSELEHFRKWLNEVYKKKYLFEYLTLKYSKEKNILMLDKVKEIMPKLLMAS